MVKKDFKTLGNQAAEKFITQGTQEEQAAPVTQKEQPARKQKHPRINMAFYGDNLEYVELIARIEGVSVTQYINTLIEADRDSKKELIEKAKGIFK